MCQNKCNAVTSYGYGYVSFQTHVSVGRLILHGFRVTVFMNAFVGIDAVQCVCVCSPHVFQSISLQIHWKLCVFCLLCEAYLRWSLLHGSEQSSDPADIIRYTKEWEFYGMFALAALGKMTTATLLFSECSECWSACTQHQCYLPFGYSCNSSLVFFTSSNKKSPVI